MIPVLTVQLHLAILNPKDPHLNVPFTNFSMGLHYSKLHSTVNSQVRLPRVRKRWGMALANKGI